MDDRRSAVKSSISTAPRGGSKADPESINHRQRRKRRNNEEAEASSSVDVAACFLCLQTAAETHQTGQSERKKKIVCHQKIINK